MKSRILGILTLCVVITNGIRAYRSDLKPWDLYQGILLVMIMLILTFNAIFPFMGQPLMPKGIAVIILGGMGDVRGAMVGGLFLGIAEVMSVAYLSSDYRDAVAFGLLFLILLVRPSGLFGRQVERKG